MLAASFQTPPRLTRHHRCALARRGQPVDDQALTGDAALRLGNVPISLREVATFLVFVHLGGPSNNPLPRKLNLIPLPAFVIYCIARTGLWIVASRADEYRRRAQQCLEMAGTFRNHDSRVTLAHMAQVWLRLANDYEDAKSFRRSKVAVQVQPVVQQQQQIQPKKG